MQLDNYIETFNSFFTSQEIKNQIMRIAEELKSRKRIFFFGNGGSNAISSHMMEDFAKIGRYQTFSFTDAALITCFANDYGFDNAMKEWLSVYLEPADVVIGISSSGNSMNVVNALQYAKNNGAYVVSLSAFKKDNKLNGIGAENFHIPVFNYGVAECFHQVIIHAVLDELVQMHRTL